MVKDFITTIKKSSEFGSRSWYLKIGIGEQADDGCCFFRQNISSLSVGAAKSCTRYCSTFSKKN